MTTPVIDWAALTPILIIMGAAVIGVLIESFVPRRGRRATQIIVSLVAVASALVAVIWRWTVVSSDGATSIAQGVDGTSLTGIGTLTEDGPGLTFQLIILVSAFFAFLVIADRTETGEGSFAASAASQPASQGHWITRASPAP